MRADRHGRPVRQARHRRSRARSRRWPADARPARGQAWGLGGDHQLRGPPQGHRRRAGRGDGLLECADVSNAVVFLCSEEGRYVSGQTFTVDAGFCVRA
ncbi:SDR family oxidoreductase [Amycolatopsis pithecellobii]|uniref:SDR family oxidoreductase n=1 Tax=Amycolatopsis pithecellobii TaxID=664692 RepID=A0A6N7YRT7_9PSEU|nr:SDR family oxidoreductase [Amycolatopsis pithecellobii]MTD54638.1 SDR family oxidoreductase [Amycolatopsis pithecellobii]